VIGVITNPVDSAPGERTKAPGLKELRDAQSNGPPPKSAHNRPTFWPELREWLQRAKSKKNVLPVQYVAIYNRDLKGCGLTSAAN
jgi:hypothetical protein